MKKMPDAEMKEYSETAIEAAKKIREYFKYEGANPSYLQKAEQASRVIGSYARIRGTESKQVTNSVAVAKLTEAQRKIQKTQLENG